MSMHSLLKDLLFPARCIFCGALLPDGKPGICPTCLTAASVFYHVPWKIPHVKTWVSLWAYQGSVRLSLMYYKFGGCVSYATIYGHHLAKTLAPMAQEFDLMTWVPISPLRRLTRYYDQVELLAQATAAELNMPLVKTLRKHRHNRKQSRIRGKQARFKNVQGVYRIVDASPIQGKHVLLLDDIVTTGATVSEAARVLREAGAKSVTVACLASATTQTY